MTTPACARCGHPKKNHGLPFESNPAECHDHVERFNPNTQVRSTPKCSCRRYVTNLYRLTP